jgi:hypothetical protein
LNVADPGTGEDRGDGAAAALEGNVADLGLAGVLRFVAASRASGVLRLIGRHEAEIHLVDGDVTLVAGPDGERAGSESPGDVLLPIAVDDRARFVFRADLPPQPGPGVAVQTVIDAVDARLDGWRRVAAVIPSTALVPSLADELPEGVDELRVDRARWRLLTAIDGRRSLAAIIARLGVSAFAVIGDVHDLVQSGIVVLAEPEREPDD